MRLSFVLVLLLLATPSCVLAWGKFGHRLVGDLAEAQLSEPVRAQVRDLLQGEAEPSLAGVASWADELRDRDDFAWTATLHYVNIHDVDCRYEATRDCRDGACVVAAIPRFAAILADATRPRAERAEALKFVVHFVGDIHQPLHAGYRPDKGGNDFQVNYLGEGTNLHGIWDHRLLRLEGLDQAAYAARLRDDELREPPRFMPPGFQPSYAVAWAESSCALTDRGVYPPKPGVLPEGYTVRMQPVAEERVRDAANALAKLLEATLGAQPAPP